MFIEQKQDKLYEEIRITKNVGETFQNIVSANPNNFAEDLAHSEVCTVKA